MPRPTMYVYGRYGFACRVCGTRIVSHPQGRDIRYTAWCRQCQPEAGPRPRRWKPGRIAAFRAPETPTARWNGGVDSESAVSGFALDQ